MAMHTNLGDRGNLAFLSLQAYDAQQHSYQHINRSARVDSEAAW